MFICIFLWHFICMYSYNLQIMSVLFLFFFSYFPILYAPTRTSETVLNRIGRNRYPCGSHGDVPLRSPFQVSSQLLTAGAFRISFRPMHFQSSLQPLNDHGSGGRTHLICPAWGSSGGNL